MAIAEVGTIMGNRYRINSQLGSGGMGVVYHATDRFTGTDVALKQVSFDVPESFKIDDNTIDYRLALAHEFRAMASLRHPHIISVLDYGFDAEQKPFFTMTYLPDAQTVLEPGVALDSAGKVDLIRQ